MTISVRYSPPGDFTLPSPPYYRPATSVTLTCRAHSATGTVTYRWSSTCSSCFASSSSSWSITESTLKSNSAGVHTCTATDSVQNTGSNSTQMKIIGGHLFKLEDIRVGRFYVYIWMTWPCLQVMHYLSLQNFKCLNSTL